MEEQVTLRDGWGNLAVTLSCKAIVVEDDKIWLRQNERRDWELPGGRLDDSEQPENTIVRELSEELGMEIENLRLIDVSVWQKDFGTNTHVGIITFYCDVVSHTGAFEYESEAGAAKFERFTIEEALALTNLPAVYKRALQKV